MSPQRTIAIIGAGSVGAAIAYSLLLRHIGATLLLVDTDAALCEAQAQDLTDAAFLSNSSVRRGTHAEAGQSDIIVITAGAKQRPGETRIDLVERNIAILKSIMASMQPIRKDAILMAVANPVDILAYFAQQLSGLPKQQVFGSGTFLDSNRLRGTLAAKLNVSEKYVHADVLGEHGDSQLIGWSAAHVGSTPLHQLLSLTTEEKQEISDSVKLKAHKIIAGKGFTSFGVAAAVGALCEAILHDEKRVVVLSHWHEDLQCYLSTPAVLARGGVLRGIPPRLDESEKAALAASAEEMQRVIALCAKETKVDL